MRDFIYLAAFSLTAAVSYYDFRERRAPDPLTLGGLLAILLLTATMGLGALASALLGTAISAGALLLARLLSRGGLGLGDVKFGALLGAALQARFIILALLASAVFALAFAAISYKLGRLRRDDELPFVPFLGAGAVAAVLLLRFTHFEWI